MKKKAYCPIFDNSEFANIYGTNYNQNENSDLEPESDSEYEWEDDWDDVSENLDSE